MPISVVKKVRMNKKEICIVIPIYKETLNSFETQSVEQCVKILSDYSIHFACPHGLSLDFYKEKFPKISNYDFFKDDYFKNLEGYNKLMLSSDFYKRYNKFSYMLLYQTDCFVFKDNLLDWCNKGYDYIGGLWFDDFDGNPDKGANIWQAGNGGFSLRKIESIIILLNSKKRLKKSNQLIAEKIQLFNKSKSNFLKALFFLPLNICGYHNNYCFEAKNYKNNEDIFFIEASLARKDFKVPLVSESLFFSWDRCPGFLYEKIGVLPFGCHAWFREDYPYVGNMHFWLNHI